jgi:hypothetical protein
MSNFPFSAASNWVVVSRAQWPSLFRTALSYVHPADFWLGAAEEKPLTVADIHALHHFASQTPVGNQKLAIIAGVDILRPEAANALLKLLEEPPAYLYLVVISESEKVLPTVASRVQRLEPRVFGSLESDTDASSFFQEWNQLLQELAPTDPSEREQLRTLLYYQPLLHSTIQQGVVLEGFRKSRI